MSEPEGFWGPDSVKMSQVMYERGVERVFVYISPMTDNF